MHPISDGRILASNSTITLLLFLVLISRKWSQPDKLSTTQQYFKYQIGTTETQVLTWFGLSLHPQIDHPHWVALTELKSVLEDQLLTEAQVLH